MINFETWAVMEVFSTLQSYDGTMVLGVELRKAASIAQRYAEVESNSAGWFTMEAMVLA